MQQYEILRGDCLAVMRTMADNSVDSVVTDPPYELGFMGKSWDASGIAYNVDVWREALRVLKPGGHLLAFSGSRTYHRMTCAIEDAGFEIRDQIMWVYGSGFPKSLDVSKAIDKAAGAVREVVGVSQWAHVRGGNRSSEYGFNAGDAATVTAPATDAARQWEGWGTALKPAHEPICVARKPLAKGCTVAGNVLAHGTGALNIDGCRVPTNDKLGGGGEKAETSAAFTNEGWRRPWMEDPAALEAQAAKVRANVQKAEALGRWPANLIHDGSDEVLAAFPDAAGQQGDLKATGRPRPSSGRFGDMAPPLAHTARAEDDKSAARFFYCAKASKSDRGPNNTHATVKPLALMQYLVRLVTPPGGHVLDPFAGSGSTIVAALREGMRATGIELIDEHVAIIEGRVDHELFGDLL